MRTGVNQERKFLNVLISAEVIRQAKAEAAKRGDLLNEYVEAALAARPSLAPRGKRKDRT